MYLSASEPAFRQHICGQFIAWHSVENYRANAPVSSQAQADFFLLNNLKYSELAWIELLFIQVPLVNLTKLLTVVYRENLKLVLVLEYADRCREVAIL